MGINEDGVYATQEAAEKAYMEDTQLVKTRTMLFRVKIPGYRRYVFVNAADGADLRSLVPSQLSTEAILPRFCGSSSRYIRLSQAQRDHDNNFRHTIRRLPELTRPELLALRKLINAQLAAE
jgi:hypothetical protein